MSSKNRPRTAGRSTDGGPGPEGALRTYIKSVYAIRFKRIANGPGDDRNCRGQR